MKFLKLREVSVQKDHFAEFKGHTLVNLNDVRKISKYRHKGESVTRISFCGLDRDHDIWVEETPQDMAEQYLKSTTEKAKLMEDFKPKTVQVRKTPTIAAPKEPEKPKPQFEDHMFDTMFEEVPVSEAD